MTLLFWLLWVGGISLETWVVAWADEDPCQKIRMICEKAGYVRNEVPDGNNLWNDCVNPVMRGYETHRSRTLPKVDPNLIKKCKEKHPHFGTNTTGST